MTAEEIKFRASQFCDLYSGVAKGWSVDNSQTCKNKLLAIYDELIFHRKDFSDNKFCEKGTLQEGAGIRIASIATGIRFKKNELRLTDELLTAIPDDIRHDKTIDFKCSWSRKTFRNARFSPVDMDYKLQGHIQMILADKRMHWLIYCLVNTPAHIIIQEIRNLRYRFEEGSKLWLDAAKQIEINNIFNIAEFQSECERSGYVYDHLIPVDDWSFDMPISERVFIHKIERDEELVVKIKKRAQECRTWMDENLFNKSPSPPK